MESCQTNTAMHKDDAISMAKVKVSGPVKPIQPYTRVDAVTMAKVKDSSFVKPIQPYT